MLFITTQLPYPPISGGVIKSWRLVEHFSKEYKLSLFCFLKGKDVNWLNHFTKRVELAEFNSQEFEVGRSYKALINSYLSNKTLNLYRNFSKQAKNTIAEMAAKVDILFVDHYEMFQYLPKDFKGKVVLHQHNAEFVLWDRFADVEPNYLKRNFLQLESKRIKRAEKRYCQRADWVLAAPNDIDKLKTLGVDPNKFKETYHLGEDDLLNEPLVKFEETEKTLLFLGTLSWEANVDGLLHFIQHCFQMLIEKEPDVKLIIVGKDADDRLKKVAQNHNNILMTGFVESVEPFYKKSRVFVLPLRFGSGMKVKFLNALYRGIPIVSSEIGAEGIAVEHNKHALISFTTAEMVDNIIELLNNQTKWQQLQQNGRELALNKYQWKDHLSELSGYLKELESDSVEL